MTEESIGGRGDDLIPQLGVSDRPLRSTGAIAACVAFAIVAALGFHFRELPAHEIRAVLPICATLWVSAELLTAFLLFSQFYVAGKLAYAWLAGAYLMMALLTIPYILTFPGVFPLPNASGVRQIPMWLWVAWHACFPLAIAAVFAIDPTLQQRTVPRASIPTVVRAVCAAVVGISFVTTFVLFVRSSSLPVLVEPSRYFSHLYVWYVMPAIVVCHVGACAFVASRLRRATPLPLWIGVALFASTLEAILKAATIDRFSFTWYMGKLDALAASSVVAIVLLYEVSKLYRRLYDAASIDALTGLANRRSLDMTLDGLLAERRAKSGGCALLLLDLDHFKQYNDRYGHVAGDDALRAVGRALRHAVYRQGDVVARYGGEEFAVLLRDTQMSGACEIAERIRSTVERSVLRIGADATSVTTSIGIAYVTDPTSFPVERILSVADRALYEAKAHGRNCVRFHHLHERSLHVAGGT